MGNLSDFTLTEDGFFLDLWTINTAGERVYPYLKRKRGEVRSGIEVTLTGRKCDYRTVELVDLISLLKQGEFDNVGRVRMKSLKGGQGNGYAPRWAQMSSRLKKYIRSSNN